MRENIGAFGVGLWFGAVCGLSACGGGGATGTAQASGGPAAGGASAGHEVAGESDGFEDFGDGSDAPVIDHGHASARELIGIHPPERPWAELGEDDREMFMVSAVLPIHAEMFREFDPSRFSQFECNTCHGDDARERHYEMPSRYLPPLPAPNSPAWERMRERNPRMYEFMANEVTPAMATQMGTHPIDESGQGFGCFGCHPRAGG